MKISEETYRRLIQLKNAGMSGRQVADVLGIGKTTVNDLYKIHKSLGFDNRKPRILFFDVETAPSFVATFNRYNANFSHDHVIQEGGWLLSAAWKFLGEDQVESCVVSPEEALRCDDYQVTKSLLNAFNQSNIVCGHYSKGFDMKVFRTRLALNNLPNHKPVKIVDTKAIARTCKFNSNKLDSLADYFEIPRKKDAGGIRSWIRCCAGDPVALNSMLDYNKHDVVILEDVYLNLQRFDKNPPNLGMFYNDGFLHCPYCGSSELHQEGVVQIGKNEYNKFLCNSCSNTSRGVKVGNKENHSKNLLVPVKSN